MVLDKSLTPNQLLEKANAAFGSGDYATAVDAWAAVTEHVAPENKHALHSNRGVALERLGRTDEAIDAYEEALRCKEDHVESWHNRGIALKRAKRLDDALASFDGAIYYKADFLPSLRGKVEVLMALSRFDDAVAAATEAIGASPGDVAVLQDRAYALYRAKRLDEAIEDLETAAGLGELSAEMRRLYAVCHSARGVELDKAGQLEEAESHYTLAIEVEPTVASCFNRAFLYQRMERTADAIAGYRHVIALDAGNAQAHAALGTLLLQAENFAEAAPALEQALALKPGAADVAFNAGFAFLKSGAPAKALALFEEARRLDPGLEQAEGGIAAAKEALATGGAGGPVAPPKRVPLPPGKPPGGAVAAPAAPAAPPGKRVPLPPGPKPGDAPAPAAPAAAPQPPAKKVPLPPGAKPTLAVSGAVAAGAPEPSPDATASARNLISTMSTAGSGAASQLTASAALGTAKAAAAAGPAKAAAAGFPAAKAGAAGGAGAAAPRSGSPAARYATSGDGVDGVVHELDALKSGGALPDGVDKLYREAWLSEADFAAAFGMTKAAFYGLAKFKRNDLKKKANVY